MRRKTVRDARERMGCLAFVEAYRLGENPEVAAVDSSLYEKTKGTDSAKTARRFFAASLIMRILCEKRSSLSLLPPGKIARVCPLPFCGDDTAQFPQQPNIKAKQP